MSEFLGISDRLTIAAYQAAHNGKLPGGTHAKMARQEEQDRDTVIDAIIDVGAVGHHEDFATPAGRLAAWATVDRLRTEAAEREANPLPVHFGWLHIGEMHKTA